MLGPNRCLALVAACALLVSRVAADCAVILYDDDDLSSVSIATKPTYGAAYEQAESRCGSNCKELTPGKCTSGCFAFAVSKTDPLIYEFATAAFKRRGDVTAEYKALSDCALQSDSTFGDRREELTGDEARKEALRLCKLYSAVCVDGEEEADTFKGNDGFRK